MAEGQNKRATGQRKAEVLSPSGTDDWKGPNIVVDGLDIDAHIERQIEQRLSSTSVPKLSTKVWIESIIVHFPRHPGEGIAAWARRLNAEAARQGRVFVTGSLENTLHKHFK
jgi:hypothetical protein